MSIVRETNEKTFNDIYSSADEFYKEASSYGFVQAIDEDATKEIFYLLTAKYGDCVTIGYSNETRWKMKLWSIVWQYGSAWLRKSKIADELDKLTTSDAQIGSTILANHARNPQNKPTSEELEYVDDQNATKYKKSKLEALALLYVNQKDEYTNIFINRFKVLFNPVLMPSDPLYIYGGSEDE